MWQAEKCNLLWKDSVSARYRIKCDRFQKSTTYPLRAVISLFQFWPNKRRKKKHFPSADRAAVKGIIRSPRILEHVRVLVPVSFRENEATGQVDARDGICTLGTPAECILRVADVKWLKGSETRLVVYQNVHSVLHLPHPNFSKDFVQRKLSLSTRLYDRQLSRSIICYFLFYDNLRRNIFLIL